jgi:MFS transporter, DHA1 family, tetracycline resistance protein
MRHSVATRAPQTHVSRALAILFSIMLMDVMGITLLYPVAPYIVRRYSSEAMPVTLLIVIYSGAQFLAAPLLGKLSDLYGRRPVLLASIFGSAVGYVIFGLGGALWVLFLSRLIDGVTGGNMSTASAYIADISLPEERASNFRWIGMAWGVGLVVGPAIGGVTGQVNLSAPAYAAACPVCL